MLQNSPKLQIHVKNYAQDLSLYYSLGFFVLGIYNFGYSRILDRRNRGRKVAPVDQGTRPSEAAFMWLSQSVLHSFLMAFF